MRKLKLRKAKYLFTLKQEKQNSSPDLSASKVCALNPANLCSKFGSWEMCVQRKTMMREWKATGTIRMKCQELVITLRDTFRARSDDGGRRWRCGGSSLLEEWDVPHERGVLGTQAEEAVLRPLDVQVGVEAAGEETDRVCDSEACESSSWTLTRGEQPTQPPTLRPQSSLQTTCMRLTPADGSVSSSADQSLRVMPWPLTSVLSQLSAATREDGP